MRRHKLNKSAKGFWYVLIGPYDADLVEAIKRQVPPSGRQWSPTAKLWRIHPDYRETVQTLIEAGADPDIRVGDLVRHIPTGRVARVVRTDAEKVYTARQERPVLASMCSLVRRASWDVDGRDEEGDAT